MLHFLHLQNEVCPVIRWNSLQQEVSIRSYFLHSCAGNEIIHLFPSIAGKKKPSHVTVR